MKSKIFFSVLLLLPILIVFPQDDIRVISSDQNSILLEYTPKFSTSFLKINEEDYVSISLSFGAVSDPEAGAPAVPVRQIPVGVPSESGNTIEIVSVSSTEMQGKINPVPKIMKIDGIPTTRYEIGEMYYSYQPSEQLVTFGDFAIVRGMPVQYFIVKPIMFSPAINNIRLYSKIIFRVTFNNLLNYRNFSKDTFLADIIPNFNVAKQWIKDAKEENLNKPVTTNSVLSAGKWIRFETREEGIYKINRALLASFGIDVATVDPRTIKIYNNGGKVLPEALNELRPIDLVENAIIVEGENDGKFDTDDYILFYGRGTNFWDYNNSSRRIVRYFHPYSTSNYYWITSGGDVGKRMQAKNSLNSTITYEQLSTQAFASWEEDKINIAKSGRKYLGDDFTQSTNSRTYVNRLDGIINNSQIKYRFNFVNASQGPITLTVDENSAQLFSNVLFGFGSSDYSAGVMHEVSAYYNAILPESRSVLKLKFSPSSSTSIGYLDFFEINYEKELKAYENGIIFFSKDTTSTIAYHLSGFTSTDILVFDITDHANLKIVQPMIPPSGSEFRFQAGEVQGNVSKYYAITSAKTKLPINPVEIPNQNLRGMNDGSKLIIIYHKNLKEHALRLKAHRENNAKLNISTTAVDVNEIYNEFSGGLMDVSAIRDYIKYAYNYWVTKPEYVLLFGEGTYDYKNLEKQNDNLIPPFETVESLNPYPTSYPIDDFFARIDGNDSRVDIALGRINAANSREARIVVDKIINYETVQSKDLWRNLVSLVADDHLITTGYDFAPNTKQSEDLSNLLPPSFDQNKIYLAAYPTVMTALGRSKPGVYDEIINTINRGTLLLNYVGHGSPDLWAHERVFVKSTTIPQLINDKYFFLTAATCDFGYYDIPGFQSGTEMMLLKEGSGAIGAFASTRPVTSYENASLNEAFYSSLLSSARDTLNLPTTVGKAYMKAKVIGSGYIINDEKFHLFCDPSLRLNIPQYSAGVDSINGQIISTDIQIKALSRTKIDGIVKRPSGEMWNDFNGEGILTVFDSKRKVLLDVLSTPTNPFYMGVQGGIIFRGRISIVNGKFSSEFVVPKDISYENANGKIQLYFTSSVGDGLGYTSKVIIGGTDSSVVNDGIGPEIEIYFDDESFDNTHLVNPNSTLIAKLSDDTGINTTGTGVGHKLEGILNERFNEPIDFTNYFTGDLDSGGKKGAIKYKFNNLAAGDYQMLLKAWDVFNNPSSEKFYFTVVPGNDLFISEIYNYPNPFSSTTTFTFQKNTINSPVDVDIKVYTIAGRLIRNLNAKNVMENFVKVDWDGHDEDGNQIANGTYLYKLNVKSTDGAFSKSVLGKLAVIR